LRGFHQHLQQPQYSHPLELIKLSGLMALTRGRADISIGLVDGSVALDHPDLATKNVRTLVATQGATVTLGVHPAGTGRSSQVSWPLCEEEAGSMISPSTKHGIAAYCCLYSNIVMLCDSCASKLEDLFNKVNEAAADKTYKCEECGRTVSAALAENMVPMGQALSEKN
jgi:hypothetical protein